VAIKRLPQQFRLTIDLTREEAAALVGELCPNSEGLSRPPVVHRLLDELEEIAVFDRPGEGDE